MPMREEDFTGRGGLRIHFREWLPEGAPRAVVAICHGVNSHGGQHAWTAEQFAAKGFAVYAVDLRGRGQSEGERFYVDDVAEYVDDIAGVIAIAKERHPGLPVFLLGHSAGGVTACTYALDHQDEIDGLICESFAFQVPAPGFVLTAIKGLSHVAPHLGVLTLKMKDFTRDPVALKALEDGPADQGRDSARRRRSRRSSAPTSGCTTPSARSRCRVLILHGTEDHATVCHGSASIFHAHAGSKDKTLKLYEGHYHDLLNDLGKEEVFSDILAWIEARLPSARA